MNKSLLFARRNAVEMLRDPILYIFCIGFPVVLIVMFAVINSFTQGNTPVFEPTSLVPGIVTFSYTFVMLTVSLLVSKDASSALLVRLYTSPMKTRNFVAGYVLPCFAVGVAQSIVCVLAGWIISLATGAPYFGFGRAVLLMLSSLPMLAICIFFGVLIGASLNDKAAPGICSVFISAAGVLGGAWMPLDTMGGFEIFCRFLPFYPSVYLGRIAAGAQYTLGTAYAFDGTAVWGIGALAVYLALSISLALFTFGKKAAAK